jgi:hypothetical protein
VDVPVQDYQSVIAIELATAGALLFQIRFFVPRGETERHGEHLPDPRLRLLMAVIIGATVFGSLAGILHEADRPAAVAVTIGLALSILPILLRALPPLTRHAGADEPDPAVTIIGLVGYISVTTGTVIVMIT